MLPKRFIAVVLLLVAVCAVRFTHKSNSLAIGAFSPIISNIFELMLMHNLQSYLQSDNLQFGFKKYSSGVHAMFALRNVVDYYLFLAPQLLRVHSISRRFLIVYVDHYAC